MSITIINIVIIIIGLIFLGVILISKKRGPTDNTNNNEQLNQKPTKHQQRRYIEFDFFPELLSIIEEEKWEDAAIFLSNVVELRSLAEAGVSGIEFEWDEVSVRGTHIDQNRVLICYKFPDPIQIPEAALGAVVINVNSCKGCYYTLETSFGGKWVLGSTSFDGTHSNYGCLENPTIASFINRVKEFELKNQTLN